VEYLKSFHRSGMLQPHLVRNVPYQEREVIELYLAVLYDIGQRFIDNGEQSSTPSPMRKPLPTLGLDTRQGLLRSGIGFMSDNHDVAVMKLLWGGLVIRVVSYGNLTSNVIVDVGHHLINLSLEARHDHDAYRLYTVGYGGI
jgi:hypothetical protein